MSELLQPVDSERAVLGSLILRSDLAEQVINRLQPDDFTDNRRPFAALIWRMLKDGRTVDPQTILAAVLEEKPVPPTDAANLITSCVNAAWNPLSIAGYADAIAQARRRRKLHTAGIVLTQYAAIREVTDLALEVTTLLKEALEDTTDNEPSPAAEDLEGVDEQYDWIFPQTLERGDRLLITAPEGGGKSVLVRQLAVCAAAGIDPFTGRHVQPRRVLMIDCENNELQSRRHLVPLLEKAASLGRPCERRLRVQLRPGGLDLTQPHDASWLLQRAQVDNPEVLCVGPLYRLHNADLNMEQDARKVASALDAARLRVGAALITETHAGHGITGSLERDLRPKGSQLWRAWPELIRALRPVPGDPEMVTVEMAGRRDRDPRHWPEALRWGRTGTNDWPWVATTTPESEARKPSRNAPRRETA